MNHPPKIGSVCTGYGGLDAAVEYLYGGETVWVADNDKGAAAILAHRYPDIPNLGDITDIDWNTVEPVDIFVAGFPCQDISYAGKGEGIQEGNRSGLWYTIVRAVGVLRPRIVVLENVAAIVSRRPGLDVVLADLARLGFVARWTRVRASDVGAPHQRNRWFLLAVAEDEAAADSGGEAEGLRAGLRASDPAGLGWGRPDHDGAQVPAADAQGDGRHEGLPGAAWQQGRPDAAFGGAATDPDVAGAPVEFVEWCDEPGRWHARRGGALWCTAAPVPDAQGEGREGTRPEPPRSGSERGGASAAADAGGRELQRRGEPVELGGSAGGAEGSGDQRQRDGDAAGHRGAEVAPDAESLGHGDSWPAGDGGLQAAAVAGDLQSDVNWGQYEPAIRRWEQLTGRPVPRPTEPGRNGERLSPRFVEWMMGLPDGWVTDVPDIAKNAKLKALGNGVVPQQAIYALWLLAQQPTSVPA